MLTSFIRRFTECLQYRLLTILFYSSKTGFCEKEVNDANIPINDPGVYIPAPAPREMIDLEV